MDVGAQMALSDDLKKLITGAQEEALEPPKKDRNAQWREGVEWKGEEGEITTAAMFVDQHPDWDAVLEVWDLDPTKFAVIEPVLFNAWDANLGNGEVRRMRQYKAKVVRRKTENLFDMEAFRDEIKKHKPKKEKIVHGEGVFNVVLADWQVGKDEGGGSVATAKRVLEAIQAVLRRVEELKRLGRPISTLQIIWTGDSVEGCLGFYEMQTFSVDLDRRGQVNTVRALLIEAIKAWAPHFEKVRLVAVGGNHGENRSAKGKAFTTFADNDDLAIIDQVKDALSFNTEAYGHVQIITAPDHLSLTVNTAGWILGITHGHTARESGTAEQKMKRWLERMALGRQPIGDCDILVTGHYHHLRQADWGSVQWLQAPALDGGSEWFRMVRGESSIPGVLTFATYPEARVKDLQVL